MKAQIAYDGRRVANKPEEILIIDKKSIGW